MASSSGRITKSQSRCSRRLPDPCESRAKYVRINRQNTPAIRPKENARHREIYWRALAFMVGWGLLNEDPEPAWMLDSLISFLVLFPDLFPGLAFATPVLTRPRHTQAATSSPAVGGGIEPFAAPAAGS